MEKFGLAEQVDKISIIHGKLFKTNHLFQDFSIIPFYHPAVVAYNPNMKEVLLEDFKILREFK
jgi:DNA polymerase